MIKNPTANAGDTRDVAFIPGTGRSPGGGNDNPHSILAGIISGQRSQMSYSPRGHKASDMTERLSTRARTCFHQSYF